MEVYQYDVHEPPTHMSLLNIKTLVSRESSALEFSIYIAKTMGDNFISNLMF